MEIPIGVVEPVLLRLQRMLLDRLRQITVVRSCLSRGEGTYIAAADGLAEGVGELARILLRLESALQLAGRIVVEQVWRAEQPLAVRVGQG